MYVNSGYQRCKTLSITKSVSGVTLTGYPKTYSILAAFTHGAASYAIITETEFKQLSEAAYLQRLSDFKAYVSAAEDSIDVDASTEEGYEAYGINTTACPIGE